MNAVSSWRSPGTSHARSGSRRSWLLATLAMLSLLAPSLAGFQPDLAGWLPAHGHVYQAGVPVPHAHPWDAIRGGVAVPSDHSHVSEAAPDADGEPASVAFTWDTASTVFAVVVPAVAVVIAAAIFLRLSRRLPPGVLVSAVFDTPTPPPR